MVKKWLFSVVVAFCIIFVASVIVSNTRISFDKDSNYIVHLPTTMKVAIVSNENSDLHKKFVIENVNIPEIGDNDVLVAVKTASFTENDFNYFKKNKGKDSFVPCTDFAGVVVKVGKSVKLYEIGDKVFGIVDINKTNGACAEYVSVPQNNIYTMPYSLSFKQASVIPTPALLNWFAVHSIEKFGLKRGKVLVDDAISETGIMLTGLLVRNGFEVTAIDDDKIETWARSYGVADFVGMSRFADEKEKFINKFDVVFNLKGGLHSGDLISLVKDRGTFISFTKPSATRDNIKTLVIDNTLIDRDIFAKMARLVHLSKIQVSVSKEYKLEQIRDAYMIAEKGNVNGKVVVNISK